MYSNVFSERIKEAREKTGLTQSEVAERIKIDRSTLAKYELGQREPDLEKLGKLAEFYEVSVDWLLGLGRPKQQGEIKKEIIEEKERRKILSQLG